MAEQSEFIAQARRLLGPDRVLDDPADCWVYGSDNSRKHAPPGLVAFPESHEEVAALVRLCNEYGRPFVARGRGTGTCGGAIPPPGGVVIALERMDRILGEDPANRTVTVQPGVLNGAVQEAAARYGLFWPPDPSSAGYCTVGGNLAFNAAGPRAVKYGTPRDNTLGLRAVSGGGEELRTGVLTTKGVVGYDLTRLIIGSEGTLAIVTEATLKLTPLPGGRRLLRAQYRNARDAAAAVVRVMTQAVTPCALEFMDRGSLDLLRDRPALEISPEAGALLLAEVDGPEPALAHFSEALAAALSGAGLLDLRHARTPAEGDALWAARKALSPALRRLAPNKLNEDVVVPVTAIPAFLVKLEALSGKYGIPIVSFGHAGNGNLHVNLLYDTEDEAQARNAEPCLRRVFEAVVELHGTLSGEHGVGKEKRDYVDLEIEPATLLLMRRIKAQFDPKGLLNPGKIFPAA